MCFVKTSTAFTVNKNKFCGSTVFLKNPQQKSTSSLDAGFRHFIHFNQNGICVRAQKNNNKQNKTKEINNTCYFKVANLANT